MNETNLENKIIETLLLWDKYADFEHKHTGSILLLKEYLDFRLCLMNILKNDYEKKKRSAPEINERNHIKIWFYLEVELNKQSLKAMHVENDYTFKKRYGGITAIKNEKLQDSENNEKL